MGQGCKGSGCGDHEPTCTNAEQLPDNGSPPGIWEKANFMSVIPKRGAEELGFSVPVSLTSVWREIMEKLIRDSADKNRGRRGV